MNEPEAPAPETRAVTSAPPKMPAGVARVAKIRCLDTVKARGFTFAKGKVVEGVPLAHAEYLAEGHKAEILHVSAAT